MESVSMMSSWSDIVIRGEVIGEFDIIVNNRDSLTVNELIVLEVFQVDTSVSDVSVGDIIGSARIDGAQTAIGDDMVFFLRYFPNYSVYSPLGVYYTPPAVTRSQRILESSLPENHVIARHHGSGGFALTVGDLGEIVEIEEMRQSDFMVSIIINTNGGPDIYDSRGNRVIFDNWILFVETPEEGRRWVGDASFHNRETWEIEYRLIPDEYTVRSIRFGSIHTPDLIPIITTTTTINHLYDSFIHYYNIPTSPHLELRVSPATTQLYNTLTRTVIEPTHIATPEELREMNERSGRLAR